MSHFAIRTPYFIVVVCLIIAVVGVTSLKRMPVDMFPAMNIPVVVVATFYSGMPPEQIETDITGRFERFFTLGSGIEHIESRSLPGVSVIKVYFQPGTNPDSAGTTISNLAMAQLRRLPPGTLPPAVLQFDASSLPVCLVTFQGDGLNETQLRDLAQFQVRNQIASVPQPFGGRDRQIMVYADPYQLEAHQLSLMDAVRALNRANLILPAGDVQLGLLDYNIYTNSQLRTVGEIDQLPLKTVSQTPVRVADIGHAEDGQQIQTNMVRVDGQRSVYVPIMKQGGDTNTIQVVDGIKAAVQPLFDVDAVPSLGMPAPIDVQVTGSNLEQSYGTALRLASRIRKINGVGDIFVPQDIDYPAIQLDVARTRARELGLTQKEVVGNIITALTSNVMIAPSFWIDPKTGNDYMLTVQYPERQIRNFDDLRAIPVHGEGIVSSTRLDAISDIRRIKSPSEVDHHQLRRVIDIYVQPLGQDLGRIAKAIDDLTAHTCLPTGVRVTLRGLVQGMRQSFASFGIGLTLFVVLLYLILVAQFPSFMDPLLILTAVPPGLTGALLILYLTGTSMNVMSLMGLMILIGMTVSDSILIVEFTRYLREEGLSVRQAVVTAARVRLQPVLMTSLATITGLLAMALKLGAGSESYAPLARAVLGGMSVSLIMAVIMVPAAYYVAYRKDDARLQPEGAR
jgi:multidrug efflux pump subunit AcrB